MASQLLRCHGLPASPASAREARRALRCTAAAGRGSAKSYSQWCSSSTVAPTAATATGRRPHPQSRQQPFRCSAAQGDGPGPASAGADSDLVFVGKLAVISFVGAAVIKYGSLLTDVAFQPNSALAALLVLLPPCAYAAYMLAASGNKA